MRVLKTFEEFLDKGIVRRRKPDIARAKSLDQEAKRRKYFLGEMLNKIGLTDKNANYFIENSYDVLMELIRAKLFSDGFSSSGEGAHEAEVSYLLKISFSERQARFMNNLRFFRNGILYYGKNFDAEYAKKVLGFLDEMYPKLKELLNNEN